MGRTVICIISSFTGAGSQHAVCMGTPKAPQTVMVLGLTDLSMEKEGWELVLDLAQGLLKDWNG